MTSHKFRTLVEKCGEIFLKLSINCAVKSKTKFLLENYIKVHEISGEKNHGEIFWKTFTINWTVKKKTISKNELSCTAEINLRLDLIEKNKARF